MNELSVVLMNIGTWGLALANLPQLWEVMKHKRDLKGYSPNGSLLIFISLLCITWSFIYSGMWISTLAQIPPVITWGLVSYYIRQPKIKVKKVIV